MRMVWRIDSVIDFIIENFYDFLALLAILFVGFCGVMRAFGKKGIA